MASKKKQEYYIITAESGDIGEVFNTKESAEKEITDLLECGTHEGDQIRLYKGVELEFTHGVKIED